MARLCISLPEDLAYLVRCTVEAGQYASVSEVVREALREWRAAHPATEAAANDIDPPVRLWGIGRFALRGSFRRRTLQGAVAFTLGLPDWCKDPNEALREVQLQLAGCWKKKLELIHFDQMQDLAEWTVVYEAALPGSDTESSSTS